MALAKPLIGRIWRGRTPAAQAAEYAEYCYREGILHMEAKPGCLGAQLFRTIKGDVAEFTTISYWESVESMTALHPDLGDPLRVWPLPRDPEFLLELPQRVELTELLQSDWKR